jgi:hypothetical protein
MVMLFIKLIFLCSTALCSLADLETLIRLGREYDSDADNLFSLRDSFQIFFGYFESKTTISCFCTDVPCPKAGL